MKLNELAINVDKPAAIRGGTAMTPGRVGSDQATVSAWDGADQLLVYGHAATPHAQASRSASNAAACDGMKAARTASEGQVSQ